MERSPYEDKVMKEWWSSGHICFVNENQIFHFKVTSSNLRHQQSCINDTF